MTWLKDTPVSYIAWNLDINSIITLGISRTDDINAITMEGKNKVTVKIALKGECQFSDMVTDSCGIDII